MGDHEARGDDFEKKAEKKLSGWGIFGSKYEDAADLFDKGANSFKLAKNWSRAAQVYIKIANCHLKGDSKHEAASAYVEAANCYKKFSPQEAAQALNQAVNLFLEIGRLNMAARYSKDIGEIYQQEQDLEKASDYLERAADLFDSEGQSSQSNSIKQKVAEIAAQLEQYPKATEIFEAIARQSINNNLLKYSVRGILLNAGICQLCRGDAVAITNSMERYQDIDPTFSGTREYKLLSDLAAAIDEGDVAKFTDAIKEFDSMTRLDPWKTTLLLRAKNELKKKEDDEDDLT
ncbi:alpha-soluble NSF attachment protein 2 [Oryza brachyantha]|uniref:Alpha-soluble NSF attachment protein n=1 Tax=Oryza brachyantha TaxID=4533 RepID=J3MRU7_ORYBR|nr:alpha-soluble NSF attachment protein 2 [Oryza brachyantha]